MSVDLQNDVIPASGQVILPPGNFFFLLNASANVNVQLQAGGITESFNGIQPGILLKRVKGWSRLVVSGSAGVVIQSLRGNETFRDDETSFQTLIATVAGTIAVQPGLGSVNPVTDHADIALGVSASDTTTIVTNARKSILIGSLSTNTVSVRVRGHGAAVGGVELQPGTTVTYQSQGAFDLINGAALSTIYWQEQT